MLKVLLFGPLLLHYFLLLPLFLSFSLSPFLPFSLPPFLPSIPSSLFYFSTFICTSQPVPFRPPAAPHLRSQPGRSTPPPPPGVAAAPRMEPHGMGGRGRGGLRCPHPGRRLSFFRVFVPRTPRFLAAGVPEEPLSQGWEQG